MSLAPSSPRLPSPPPAAEIQMAPMSPSGGPAASLHTTPQEQSQLEASSRRRIHPGTKAADMAAGPPLIPLQELDSAFQLQEHLAALHCYHTSSNTQPITRGTALQLATPPNGVDRTIWLYELCRFLISQCNSLIVGFLFDTPPCSASTCPEMRASEWQFLCAVHEQPKSCCAIDYCCHTLDWAANVVTDQKIFPSRFVVHNDNHSKNVGVKNLVNVFRRLHRIFAHAWFQHRGVFWSVEAETGLYVLFKTVCDLYDLLPAENYKLPPEAEGLEAPHTEQEPEKPPPTILKPSSHQRGPPAEEDNMHPTRTNTRRHIRSSPSTGSAVTTVIEAEEEEPAGVSRKLKDMHLTAPSPVEEEPEVADVPSRSPSAEKAKDDDDDDDDEDEEIDDDADQTVVGSVSEHDSANDDDTQTDEHKPAADSVESTQSTDTGGAEDAPTKENASVDAAPDADAPESSEAKDKSSEDAAKTTDTKSEDET
ncbi:Mps one binder kinase activator-like 4 [Fusarium tjaetaba]|uniref:Mps one binder kinase activator-like 4 n=1 Tax=Fusarium tjaetaba TaxID=1567544 RepID=A0A8H5VPL2_9HYPO|nr:Mps one binder kinase activator-like 4 [Fusarium tjaetaba]KAF5632657.1 Mps one binder kinase activator-like 4 [Fusarium tjaetaba]